MVDAISPATFGAASAATFGEHLTPDALMTYLSSRLDGLDTQINGIFSRQRHTHAIQKALKEVRDALGNLKTDEKAHDPDALNKVHKALDHLTNLDPDLGAKVRDQLNQPGHAFGDLTCSAAEMKATMDYLDGVVKDSDSGSQLDMIHLQSIMSARQTAIQLSTNLVAALAESTKAIVSNIGR
jgi:hypothetical protein